MATGKILAHASIAAKLTELLVEKADHLPVGNPALEQVALGAGWACPSPKPHLRRKDIAKWSDDRIWSELNTRLKLCGWMAAD
jgi:hypothetical protein